MRGAMLLACERSGSAQRCIPGYRFKQRIWLTGFAPV